MRVKFLSAMLSIIPMMKPAWSWDGVLDRKEWGKGYASAITKMVTEESGSSGKELVIECSPEQKATKRIAQKYGFQFCSVVNGCEVYRLRRK